MRQMPLWEKQPTECELEYAAGFLDGEGCFTAHNNRVQVNATNTYKPAIEWLQATFGGNINESTHKKKPQWRPTYSWTINGKHAYNLCQVLAPYLKEKMAQAGLIIAYYQCNDLEERSRLHDLITGEKRRVRA